MQIIILSLILKGFVKDITNGEGLEYASIYIKELNTGTYTDESGYFIIKHINIDKITVQVSYVGYKSKTIKLDIKKTNTITVELTPYPLSTQTIRVSALRERFKNEVDISRVNFQSRDLNYLPSLLESDLIRSLQTLPGIITMHDLSNKIYIRGGTPDEILMYLDGITIYNPASHLFGLFSTFNTDAVKNVEMYAGAYPARFGDRLSAVINITTKNGNSKRLRGELSQSFLSTRLFIEGPILNKSTFLLSFRRTYFDFIVWLYSYLAGMNNINLPYYFYDFLSKYRFSVSKNLYLSLTLYGSDDIISFTDETSAEAQKNKINIQWGNRGFSTNLFAYITPSLYGNLTIAYSLFHTDLNALSTEETIRIFQHIHDFTLKPDFTLKIDEKKTLLFGFDMKYLTFSENSLFSYYRDTTSDTSNTFLFPAYCEFKYKPLSKILFDTGIRSIYSYTLKNVYINPILSAKYFISDFFTFNISLGKYNQFLYTINSQEAYFSIYDIWKPVKKPPVPENYHIVSGIENLFSNGSRFRLEAFYKYYKNVKIPKNSNFMFSFPEDSIYNGTGYSYGIEFFLKGKYKFISGWITYTFTLTRRKYLARWYAPAYDRTHSLNLVLSNTFGKNTVILRWTFGTGLPTSGIIGKIKQYYYDPIENSTSYTWETIYSLKDGIRLPPSHRLDLHIERKFKAFSLPAFLFLDVINIYMQKNIVFYEIIYRDEDSPPEIEGYSFLPPVPIITLGIKVKL